MRLLVAVLAASCTPPDEEVVSLAEFPVTSIAVNIASNHTFHVRLDYPPPYDTCLVLADNIVATAGGVELAIDPGAFMSRFDGYPDCLAPSASLDHLPQVSPATFEIHDRTRTITCALDSALVARVATLVPDGPWRASAGETLTVRWPSAAELATHEMSVKVGPIEAAVSYPGGDLLSFAIPQPMPAGTHRLRIRRSGKFFRTIACEGLKTQLTEPDDLTTFVVDLEIL